MGQFLSTPQPTIISATANSFGVMTLVLSDGSSYSVQLPSGKDGVSVTGASINSDGNLILAMSNDETIDAGKINTTSESTTPTDITISGDVTAGGSLNAKKDVLAPTGNIAGVNLVASSGIKIGNEWITNDGTWTRSKAYAAENIYASKEIGTPLLKVGDWTIVQDGNGYLVFYRPNGSRVVFAPENPPKVPQRGI